MTRPTSSHSGGKVVATMPTTMAAAWAVTAAIHSACMARRRGCIWERKLIGVMSKRSRCLAAAAKAGRFECDV